MTMGGILFGWASISGSLLISSRQNGGPGLSSEYVNGVFVVASFFSFLGPFLLGILLDSYGPRVCSIISAILIAFGFALFALSDTIDFPMFIPAMCLIAFAGPGAQSSVIHVSNLFPSWKATATAIITGSFQLSFAVFLIFDQLWLYGNWDYQSLFMSYCLICLINIVLSFFIWPDQPYRIDDVDWNIEADEVSHFISDIYIS